MVGRRMEAIENIRILIVGESHYRTTASYVRPKSDRSQGRDQRLIQNLERFRVFDRGF